MTLFTKLTLPAATDLEIDIESAGGSGIGNALGLAAYVNLDVVRNPSLGSTPYLARAVLHHSFLGSSQKQRLDVYLGQFSTVDWFDVNAVGSDSHTQFLNWAIDNNAAYDYAADTRGYTRGVVVQWITKKWELRAAEAMMPTVANGLVPGLVSEYACGEFRTGTPHVVAGPRRVGHTPQLRKSCRYGRLSRGGRRQRSRNSP